MRKLRIGYLSDGFCQGEQKDFLAVYFTAKDKYCFEVYGYQAGNADAVTKLFEESADGWNNLQEKSSLQAVKEIRKDKLDLLVILGNPSCTELIAELAGKNVAGYILQEKFDRFCYMPFAKVRNYAVYAPLLDRGELTIDYLDGRTMEEIPYQELDIGLYRHTPSLAELCHALDNGLPVVVCDEEKNEGIRYLMEELGLAGCYAVTEVDFARAVLNLSEQREEICRLHRELHARLHASKLMDIGHYIIEQERKYFQIAYGEKKENVKKLLSELEKLQEKKNWKEYVRLHGKLVGMEAVPTEKLLIGAWAYNFLQVPMRTLHWARKAEEHHAEKLATQLYLQAKALWEEGHWAELGKVCQRILDLEEAGKELLSEIRFDTWRYMAFVFIRLGDARTTMAYRKVSELSSNEVDRRGFFSASLLSYNFQEVSLQKLYEEHVSYNQFFTGIEPYTKWQHQSGEKLRIGYISPDFRNHVMSTFCWPFLASFNREKFEVYAYNIKGKDDYAKIFSSLVTCWRDVKGKTCEEIAHQIHEDGIDILVDLAGHTSDSGLPALAWKPAPIQVSGLGYMTTTGLSAVDYFFTDSFVDPVGLNEAYFSERFLRLKSQFCYNANLNLAPSEGTPARDRGWILFGVFNQYVKITDEMALAWKEIMERVPRSRLLIKNGAFADERAVLLAYRRLEALGMDMNRIYLEPPSKDYMERYLEVDIALDTYPYPGGGTTCDALYMGVPVISRYSNRHSARFTYGMLSVVGLGDLASDTREGYVEKAVELAHDMELLDGLHRNLRTMMKASRLMDPVKYIEDVEENYCRIWKEYQEGKA